MAAYYLDTSALVKGYARELGTTAPLPGLKVPLPGRPPIDHDRGT